MSQLREEESGAARFAYGTSENAVKTQIWIAVSDYVLVAIVRKRLGLEASLYQILQIPRLTLFEKNTYFMRSSGHRPGRKFRRKRQTADSLRLLTGQQWEKHGKVKKSKGNQFNSQHTGRY